MNKLTQSELNCLLRLHQNWLNSEDGGKRLDLSDTDVSGLDMRGSNLTEAILRGANMTDAILIDADLRGAILIDAILTRAILRDADLTHAILIDADLTRAILTGTILRGAHMTDAIGNNREIKTYQFNPYTVVLCEDRVWIGCENHTWKEWLAFSDNEIEEMDDDALAWWKKHKTIIQSLIDLREED